MSRMVRIMAKLDEWKKTAPNTLKIDWAAVEEKLGFTLHEELKSFYSRITAKNVSGEIKYDAAELVKEYVNRKDWLVGAHKDFPNCQFELISLEKTDTDYVCDFFKDAFFGDWTGGNDFGRRAFLGEIIINIGQISLVFNNDTGRFEWVDFGWGYCDVYEDNPYGILADSADELLAKLHK